MSAQTDVAVDLDVDLDKAVPCEMRPFNSTGLAPLCGREATWRLQFTCEEVGLRSRFACDAHHARVTRSGGSGCGTCKRAGRGSHIAWLVASWRLT